MDELRRQSGDSERGPSGAQGEQAPEDGADAIKENPVLEAHGAPRNFCNRCGVRWDPAWIQCPHCEEVGLARASRSSPASVRLGRIPGRPLAAALSLYFTLLGLNAFGMILRLTEAASEASVVILVSLVSSMVVFGFVVGTFSRVRDGMTGSAGPAWYAAAVALGCFTFATAVLATKLLVSIFGIEELNYSKPFLKAGHGWGMVVLIVCVVPAVVEELAFRGVILASLRCILGVRDAVIVSALLFTVLHLMVLSFPHLFLIGLILGYLRTRTGSLYPCMVMHFAHNLLGVLAELGGT